MNPDTVIEPVTQRVFSGSPGNSTASEHTLQGRLLPYCSYVSILQKHLAPRGDFSGFCSSGSRWYQVILWYFLGFIGYVICHVLSYKGGHLGIYSLPYYHYLLTHFQHDRSLVLGIVIFHFCHTFGKGLLRGIHCNAHRNRNQSTETKLLSDLSIMVNKQLCDSLETTISLSRVNTLDVVLVMSICHQGILCSWIPTTYTITLHPNHLCLTESHQRLNFLPLSISKRLKCIWIKKDKSHGSGVWGDAH